MPPPAMKAVNRIMTIDTTVAEILGNPRFPLLRSSKNLLSRSPMDGIARCLLSGMLTCNLQDIWVFQVSLFQTLC